MAKKNKPHHNLPPQPVGTEAPEVTPLPAPTPLEPSCELSTVEELDPAPQTEAPEVSAAKRPSWHSRVSAHAAERQQLFDVKPGSFLARRSVSPVRRHELERKGHNVERLIRLGVVVRVIDSTETTAP